VDIDPQAVEVTKLSLLLKVLEGESSETIGSQLALFQERVLPDLGRNIKCGNSLIGYDYFEGRMLVEQEERERVNAFDWKAEFPQVFAQGGFDAVFGNPPYGAEFTKEISDYLQGRYKTYVGRGESYLLFTERAISLLKTEGYFSFIIPDTYLNLGFTKSIRDYLLKNTKIKEIVVLPVNVFESATVDTTLLLAEKADSTNTFHQSQVDVKVFDKKANITTVENPNRIFQISTTIWNEQDAFLTQSDPKEFEIIKKMERENSNLENYGDMFSGIKVYEVGKGKPPQTKKTLEERLFTSTTKIDHSFSTFYDGKHIARYANLWQQNNWIKYGQWLAAPRNQEWFEGEKILIRKIVGGTLIANYIPETSYCNTLLFVVKLKPNVEFAYKYLLGILNARLIGWYFRNKFQISEHDTFPQIMIRDILQFPIPSPDKVQHDKLASLVERMLELHKRPAARTPQEQEMVRREIASTDEAIDKLVYTLYGLTEEEIKIVEG